MKSPRLAVHVLYDNVIDLAETSSILQDLPWLVGMEMDLDQFVISHREKSIPLKMLRDIIRDLVLVKIRSLDEQLRVITIF